MPAAAATSGVPLALARSIPPCHSPQRSQKQLVYRPCAGSTCVGGAGAGAGSGMTAGGAGGGAAGGSSSAEAVGVGVVWVRVWERVQEWCSGQELSRRPFRDAVGARFGSASVSELRSGDRAAGAGRF